MKIIVYKDNFEYGGDTKYFSHLLNSFKKKDQCQISVFFSNKSDQTRKFVLVNKKKYKFFFIKKNQIPTKSINNIYLCKFINKLNYLCYPIYFFLDFLFFTKKIIPAKPDIIISFNGGYPGSLRSLSFTIVAGFYNIKNFLIVASIPSKRNFFLNIYDFILDFCIKKYVYKIIVNSKNQSNLLNKYRKIPYSKLAVLYNGLKIIKKRFSKINFKGKEINFGVVSRLDENKKIDLLINLFNNFSYKDYIFNLLIIGNGNQEKYLKKISRKNKNNRVIFLGYKNSNEVIKILRNKIDIYLFSSIIEGMPYSILESINLGVPIISSNAGGGVSELFKNKKDLVVLKKFNQNNFNKAVINYLRSPQIAEKFRNNAYLKLTKYFNIIDMQKKFKHLLEI